MRVYFDHNATTPVDSQVKEKIPTWVEAYGNPSSIHAEGRAPKALLRDARRSVARFLGADPLEIVFTSGGSESNNLILQGFFNQIETGFGWSGVRPLSRNQLILSSVEHPSVMKTAEFLKRKGFQVDFIPVNRSGELDMEAYEKLLSEKTALVSVMFANNETGVVFPVKKLCAKAQRAGALFHCDAVQSLGKSFINLKDLGVDFASFSAHKFYALKGCGVAYFRRGTSSESQIFGGGQERGRRAGTENILSIASFGLRCEEKVTEEDFLHLKSLQTHFEGRLLREIENIHIVGAEAKRLPNTSKVLLKDVDGETLLMNLDVSGFSVSTGAACSSGNPEPSPVLLAMGYSRQEAQSSLRVSFGRENRLEEVDRFMEVLKEVVGRLRKLKEEERQSL
jgi:cysteine desulfurase